MLISSPAAAQAPTVTPWPGPAATATAAANLKAQAEIQRQQANDLARQAVNLSTQADANYSAAAQANSDARAALAAQQAGIAGEAIGRAEASINDGKAQLAQISEAVNQLRELYDLQAGQLISVTIELQQARADKQTIANAYNAALATQEQSDRSETLLRILGLFAVIVFFGMLLAFAAHRLRQRAMRADDGGATGEAEIIDNEALN